MQANQYYQLWYVRREGELQGPFPALQVRKFAVVGRIRPGDELSTDREQWVSLAEGLRHIPIDRMSPAAREDANAELIAKMREDERSGIDRRNLQEPTQQQLERRSGHERRAGESDDVMRRRLGKTEFLQQIRPFSERYRTAILTFVLLSAALMYFGYIHLSKGEHQDIECSASPVTGQNLSHCSLAGVTITDTDLSATIFRNADLAGSDLHGNNFAAADFSYANLEFSTFEGADLTEAMLIGTNLRGVNFGNVKMAYANLSYADLSGASLQDADTQGADFSFALWTDGRICKAKSIGGCR